MHGETVKLVDIYFSKICLENSSSIEI